MIILLVSIASVWNSLFIPDTSNLCLPHFLPNPSNLWLINLQSFRELTFGSTEFLYSVFAFYFISSLVLSILFHFFSFFGFGLLAFSDFLIWILRLLIFSLFFFSYTCLLCISLITPLAASQKFSYVTFSYHSVQNIFKIFTVKNKF